MKYILEYMGSATLAVSFALYVSSELTEVFQPIVLMLDTLNK
jgi:hypothetical protein